MGETLERLGAPDTEIRLPELAFHFLRSGDCDRGVAYGTRAAEAAMSGFAGQDAARLYSESTGIDRVFVNGEAILEQGEFTDRGPGKFLRSGEDTRTPSMV